MKLKSRDVFRYSSILLLIVVISIFHYRTSTHYRYLHEIYQRVYYIPIMLAAFWYGPLLGVLAATLTSIIYLYHIQRDWAFTPSYAFNQYAEIILYHAIALIIGILSQRERRQRQKLEKTSDELRVAYRKQKETFDYLQRSERLAALGKLSAGIAHEIRNPLGSIKGSIEILEGEIPADSPKREFIRIIKEETARLNSIVGEFLKFARRVKPAMKPTWINELVDSTLVLLQKEASECGITVSKNLDPGIPEANLDPDQIRQVLLNVILNGIQAMPQGGVLQVRTGICRDGSCVSVEISDTGAGIEGAEIQHVFDPFYTTKDHGSGLGLSISFQLVESHGGRIEALRNPDRGMTFRVELPLTPPGAARQPPTDPCVRPGV
jgi:two-component system sensor histidine kinase HydH